VFYITPKINVLPKHIADLIAAGEVVERPASVVKELMENAIDAGATQLTVEIKNGGVTYIRVTDNGCGIPREDVPKAFLSHATSKIAVPDDLEAILTLGFRGEALASVGAVSRVELLTRTHDETAGTRYVIESGEQILIGDAGCPQGTTIVVRDLFYNTPARMKFLKKDVSEANAVAGVVDRIALSRPDVSVRLIRDGRETLLTPGDGKLESAVYAVFGGEFLSGLTDVRYESGGISAQGYVSKHGAARPNRSMQFFFLNGRLIKTGTGSAALTEAYKNELPAGKFPACVLNLAVPPNTVDVNVHPAKIEVRFADEKAVFGAVYYAAKQGLGIGNKESGVKSQGADFVRRKIEERAGVKAYMNTLDGLKAEQLRISVQPDTEAAGRTQWPAATADNPVRPTYTSPSSLILEDKKEREFTVAPKGDAFADFDFTGKSTPPEAETMTEAVPEAEPETRAQPPEACGLVGEAFKTYILAERGDTLLIIDKHAAHERILFERLRSQEEQGCRQLLLAPVTVTLSKEEYAAALENLELLEEHGFLAEDFGAKTLIVRECPVMLDASDVADVMMEIAGYLAENRTDLTTKKAERIYMSTACRAAIKAGDFTSDYEKERFVETLLSMPEIRNCPHGRPVMAEMTRRELEKRFGRI